MKQGKFIVIEGGEGSGKGTMIKHLTSVFPPERVCFTREPGGLPFGEHIRELLLREQLQTVTELLLFEAARAEHVRQVIQPALHRGIHVICDRFDASTFAYQVFARWKGAHRDLFENINSAVVGDTVPDLYLFCDVAPEVALERRMNAGGEITRFDREDIRFHEEVYRGYKEFFTHMHPSSAVVAIDASRNIAEVSADAESIIRDCLGI